MWYKLKRILIYPDGVTEKQVYPAWWKPWSNTLAYFPLVSDALDHSWNWRTLTNTWTKATIWYTFTDTSMVSWWFSNCVFVSAWIKNVSFSWYTSTSISLDNPIMWYYMYNTVYWNKFFLVYPSDSRIRVNWPSSPTNWHHICFWYDWTKSIYAIDWVVQTIYNWKWDIADNDVYLFRKDSWVTANVNISEAIFESVCWTAQEISDYYNLTKWNYWL